MREGGAIWHKILALTSKTLSVGLRVADVGLTSTETCTAESLLLSMLSPRSYARTRGCFLCVTFKKFGGSPCPRLK